MTDSNRGSEQELRRIARRLVLLGGPPTRREGQIRRLAWAYLDATKERK